MRFAQPNTRPRTLPMDITAMVDVVFLLIIFFVTTSNLIERTRERLDLPPEPGEDTPANQPASLVVNITPEGRIIVEGQPLSLDALMRRVTAEIDRAGPPESFDLLLRADQDAPLATVNRIAERLANLGVRAWRLATHVPAAPRPTGDAP